MEVLKHNKKPGRGFCFVFDRNVLSLPFKVKGGGENDGLIKCGGRTNIFFFCAGGGAADRGWGQAEKERRGKVCAYCWVELVVTVDYVKIPSSVGSKVNNELSNSMASSMVTKSLMNGVVANWAVLRCLTSFVTAGIPQSN
jgi:hypothetical protein